MLIIIGGYLIKKIIIIFIVYIMEELPNPDLVIFKNVLHKNKTENDIINIILKKVSLLNDDLKKYKFDGEFLLYICNLVEHLVGSNKFDKKKLVLNIVGSIFNLNLSRGDSLGAILFSSSRTISQNQPRRRFIENHWNISARYVRC